MAPGRRSSRPDFRCSKLRADGGGVCTARATLRHGSGDRLDPVMFFCASCAPKGATKIPRDQPYHVVSITTVVAIVGTSEWADHAKADAVGRLRQALRELGARMGRFEVQGHAFPPKPVEAPLGRLALGRACEVRAATRSASWEAADAERKRFSGRRGRRVG